MPYDLHSFRVRGRPSCACVRSAAHGRLPERGHPSGARRRPPPGAAPDGCRVFVCIALGGRALGALPSAGNACDRSIASTRPGGSLRDRILASLESGFARDRDGSVVAWLGPNPRARCGHRFRSRSPLGQWAREHRHVRFTLRGALPGLRQRRAPGPLIPPALHTPAPTYLQPCTPRPGIPRAWRTPGLAHPGPACPARHVPARRVPARRVLGTLVRPRGFGVLRHGASAASFRSGQGLGGGGVRRFPGGASSGASAVAGRPGGSGRSPSGRACPGRGGSARPGRRRVPRTPH
ncbi:hypothetical protein amrb99_90130 [Actinomadura sp. RB99]|nr:hypothetical protein [Actinomadura sp. RB99]